MNKRQQKKDLKTKKLQKTDLSTLIAESLDKSNGNKYVSSKKGKAAVDDAYIFWSLSIF